MYLPCPVPSGQPSHRCTHNTFFTVWLLKSKYHSVSSVYTIPNFFLKHDFYPDELLPKFLGISNKHCSEAEEAGI